VLILFEAGNLLRAKAFCASADLRAAMKKAGVRRLCNPAQGRPVVGQWGDGPPWVIV